jgi:hypothetical protein
VFAGNRHSLVFLKIARLEFLASEIPPVCKFGNWQCTLDDGARRKLWNLFERHRRRLPVYAVYPTPHEVAAW